MKATALCVALAALSLSACDEFATETWRGYSESSIGPDKMMLTTADVRFVVERPNPYPKGRSATIFCAEPSPDVAKALSTALSASAKVSPGGAAPGEGEGSLGIATAESLAQLTARVPSIQALRDGLFRACEAYGNGVLGANAYAMILSRYGDLLVTLMLAEDTTGSLGKDLLTLQGLDLTQAKPSSDDKTKPNTVGDGTGDTAAPKKPAKTSTQGAGDTGGGSAPAQHASAEGGSAKAGPLALLVPAALVASPAAGAAPAAPGAGAAPQTPPGGSAPPVVTPAPMTGTKPPPPAPAPPPPKADGTQPAPQPIPSTATALEQMQQNFFDQTLGKVGPMFVMCANLLELGGRDGGESAASSDGLPEICRNLIVGLERAAVDGAPYVPLWELCRIVATADKANGSGGPSGAAAKSSEMSKTASKPKGAGAGGNNDPSQAAGPTLMSACAQALQTLTNQMANASGATLVNFCADMLDPTKPRAAGATANPAIAQSCGSLMQAMMARAIAVASPTMQSGAAMPPGVPPKQ